MPHLIPDTPENIASACMQGPPKEEWEYLSLRLGGSLSHGTPPGSLEAAWQDSAIW